jgi:hypothetical protein
LLILSCFSALLVLWFLAEETARWVFGCHDPGRRQKFRANPNSRKRPSGAHHAGEAIISPRTERMQGITKVQCSFSIATVVALPNPDIRASLSFSALDVSMFEAPPQNSLNGLETGIEASRFLGLLV